MTSRPNPDFLRGLLAAYALSLAWLNAGQFWTALGLWIKYHRYLPLAVWSSLAILAAYLFVAAALAFPGRRRLLAGALLLGALAVLPIVLVALYWKAQPAAGFLPAFLANEALRLAAALGAWFLFRRQARA